MVRKLWMALLAAVVLLAGGCVFFAATSDFYVDNRSVSDLTVAWTRVDGEVGEATVAAGDRVMLMTERLIETDIVLPSHIMATLTAAVNGVVAYTQDPVNDGTWERTEGSGAKEFIFDLVLTDEDLSP